ncbi:unnamed protein product [Caenorhabditis brenneri]
MESLQFQLRKRTSLPTNIPSTYTASQAVTLQPRTQNTVNSNPVNVPQLNKSSGIISDIPNSEIKQHRWQLFTSYVESGTTTLLEKLFKLFPSSSNKFISQYQKCHLILYCIAINLKKINYA